MFPKSSGFLKEAFFSLIILIILWYLSIALDALWLASLIVIFYCFWAIRKDGKRFAIFALGLLIVLWIVINSSIKGTAFLAWHGNRAIEATLYCLAFFSPIIFLIMETMASFFNSIKKKM